MDEVRRFMDVATRFADQVSAYGPKSVALRPRKSEADGWWAKVGSWPYRPDIAVWYDRTLRTSNPLFWFGFQSDKGSITILADEMRFQGRRMVPVTDADWEEVKDSHLQLTTSKAHQVVLGEGLVHEGYSDKGDDYDYLGLPETCIQSSSDIELVSKAARLVGEIVESLDPSLAEHRDIEEIKKRSGAASREALILARRGQGRFRADLSAIWSGCAVTKCKVPEVLRASHIRAWEKCDSDDERLSANNGLLLNATLAALFDRGLISFRDADIQCFIQSRTGAAGNSAHDEAIERIICGTDGVSWESSQSIPFYPVRAALADGLLN